MIVHRLTPCHRADDYGRIDLDVWPGIARKFYRSLRATQNPAVARLIVVGTWRDAETGRVPS